MSFSYTCTTNHFVSKLGNTDAVKDVKCNKQIIYNLMIGKYGKRTKSQKTETHKFDRIKFFECLRERSYNNNFLLHLFML